MYSDTKGKPEGSGEGAPASASCEEQTTFSTEGAAQLQPPQYFARSRRLPLTESQKEIWTTALFGGDAGLSLNRTVLLRVRGNLNLETLRRAIQALVDRHDSLRTSFDPAKPEQEIFLDLSMPVATVDKSGVTLDEQVAWLADELDRETGLVFDLTQPPLVRARIIKFGLRDHLLLMTFNHLVADSWSIGVLLHELKEIYQSKWSGRPACDDAALQYAQYVSFQATPSNQERVSAAEVYWLKQFSEIPPSLDLPSDHPRPPRKTFRAARETEWMTPELYRAVKNASALHGTTLLTFLLASLKVFVHRLTGQEDVVLGLPAAGQIAPSLRDLAGSRALVGHCVNFLPIRSHCNAEELFSDYLLKLSGLILSAYEHQDLAFGTLIERLRVPHDLCRLPLVSMIFNVDQGFSKFEMGDLETEVETPARGFVIFDIEVNLVDYGNDIRIEWAYNRDLFDPSTMERWLRCWKTLLNAVVTEPRQAIGVIEVLDPQQRRCLLEEWNDTRVAYPSARMIHELFEVQVERSPESVAVAYREQQLTYRDLNRRANQLARHLKELGVGPEVRVGISVNRSEEMVVGLLAILKAGGVYLPLDPVYPRGRLEFMLGDASVAVVLTTSALRGSTLPELEAHIVCLDLDRELISRQSGLNLVPEGRPENLAYIIYTSGSTGQPKGVQIPHRAMVNLLTSVRHKPGIELGDVLLAVTTLSFDIAGLEIFLPLAVGARVVVASREVAVDGARLMELMKTSGTTIMQATPATWRLLLEAGWKASSRLKVLCGGEPLPADLAVQVVKRCASLWNLYGPTETTVWSTVGEVVLGDHSITIGRPLGNTQVYLLDKRGNPVPVGVPGELYIGGDGLARGYVNRPDLTAERFVPDPLSRTPGTRLYRTGDLARYLPDGNIEFLGRIDNQVKIRGFRIELGEIEAALCRHSSVEQAVVICREDSGEKRLVAYFTVNRGGVSITELRNSLKRDVPEYMVPAVFIRLDRLPLTANGKVDRRALPDPVGSEGPAGNEYCPPRDRLEHQLANIWESLLQLERVGVKDNFFELGGHSLPAVKLLAQINQSLGRNLPLVSVFQAPTVELMAQLLRQQGWTSPGESLVVVQPNGAKPPFFCVHGFASYTRLAVHLGQDQPVYGLVQGLDGNRFYTRVEELAAHYLRDVKTICSKGPYLLGGHSFGGLVAFEMAQQLRKAGEEVALLALFDPDVDLQLSSQVGNSKPQGQSSSERFGSRILRHLRHLQELPRETRAAYVRERFGMILTLLGRNGRRLKCEMYLRLRRPMPPALRTLYIGEFLFGDLYPAASRAYRPKPYDGRAVLIHTGRRDKFDPEAIWRELIPYGLTSYLVPGTHLDILHEPLIAVLTGHLRDCIDNAQETRLATK